MYLDDGLRRYVYWIVVNNSKRSKVLRIAQGRGNQENLIKDFKLLGLAHIPTGSLAANQAYHDRGTGLELEDVDVESGTSSVMRFQRYRYQIQARSRRAAQYGRSCRRE